MGTSSVEPSTALATIQTITATDLFKPGAIDMILERIEREAREQAASLEISTEVSRQAIASLAYKIARSKTYIDDRGKDLGESLRTQLEAINSERRRARERLDLLKDEVRKPLTDWENLDNARQAAHERELMVIENAGDHSAAHWQTFSAEAMRDRLKEIESDPRSWEEYAQRAAGVKAVAKAQILNAIQRRDKSDAEQAELARLRAEEAERAIKEREQAAARAATDAAEKRAREAAEAAQRAAQAELRRIENERAEAEARARQAEEQRKRDAEFAEQKRVAAEQEAMRQLELAETRRVEAAAQAKRDQDAAIEAERQRVAAEAEAERVAAEKREANKRHRTKIGREVEKAFVKAGLSPKDAGCALAAIADGLIPHVSIEY